ncbi:hypothetical protein CACET_c27160 [Clostridium aceticum]|uniref:Uncharacterized protein n=1 Tax=Clostridium aceticum TaxID=84022 RepID=A0A0G3WBZ4_9CLOT|nr:hypothetical protein [Clostridium aceticum]AKL96161.1 hypothetical protein CACET_c27160 [Clostridium aceticum]
MKEIIRFILTEASGFGIGLLAFCIYILFIELIRKVIERLVKWIGIQKNKLIKSKTC